ncbi:MAG: hypothetical protein QNI91_13755 [Arenicellales bacterium]|nr:hypothetical protein [Arenicellales bacterium]
MTPYGSFGRIATALGLALTIFSVYGQNDTSTTLSPTPSTGAGPEYDAEAPYRTTFWREGDPGERLVLSGRVLDTGGKPLVGAVVDVWQADGAGHYHPDAYRGKLTTDSAGKYIVRTAVPGNTFGAKHIHMMVAHDNHATVTTRVVFKGDPNLSEWDRGAAIVLEETRVKDEIVYVGTFDVVMPGR